ncbi:Hypothetical_protein [Hexamita inflata]|uniref:Hypothetical_protein n=1 Tax=Hexamita inflata TaxID=28002 RepID=A0AA86USY4_9EUKA|nr:Hypothetical protein HINF_LOCUS51317 [Hexamita inflata]
MQALGQNDIQQHQYFVFSSLAMMFLISLHKYLLNSTLWYLTNQKTIYYLTIPKLRGVCCQTLVLDSTNIQQYQWFVVLTGECFQLQSLINVLNSNLVANSSNFQNSTFSKIIPKLKRIFYLSASALDNRIFNNITFLSQTISNGVSAKLINSG